MPIYRRETVLCRYHYDPLDRLVDCTPFEQAGIQRFYCKSRLATEIQDVAQCSIFQYDDQLLAQQQHQGTQVDTTLLATDQQRSVLNALDATQPHPLAYTPYGHRPPENGLLSLLGFNGERPDPVTGHYHLGNGYRQFNPVLMRFNSPDSWSPFEKGGLNAYVYCGGDPKNRLDPSGQSFKRILKGFKNRIGVRTPGKSQKKTNTASLSNIPSNSSQVPAAKLVERPKNNAIDIWETNTSNNKLNMNSPTKETINPLFETRTPLSQTTHSSQKRRTKSLDLTNTPEMSNAEIEALLIVKKDDKISDYLTSMFANSPETTQARLYAALTSELSEFPNPKIQRTIRTGGRK